MVQCCVCGKQTELFSGGVPLCLECDEARAPHRSEAIERLLIRGLNHARKAYEEANEAFFASAGIRAGIPLASGTLSLINAGKAYRFTMEAYAQALREYNHFVATGAIPERLKTVPGRARAQAAGSSVP